MYEDGQSTEPAPDAGNPETTATTGPDSPATIDLDGKQYTEDQVRNLLGGNMRQQDYTQKTQAIAEERRALEEERAAFEEQRSAAPEVTQSRDEWETTDDVEALNNRMAALRQDTQELKSLLKSQVERDERARLQNEAEEQFSANLDGLEGLPYFDRTEVSQFMLKTGLHPGQERVAYDALYGSRIGRKVGETAAAARGATAPTVMGAGQASISPGFTHPTEVPGAADTIQTMQQARDAAMNDPEIQGLT